MTCTEGAITVRNASFRMFDDLRALGVDIPGLGIEAVRAINAFGIGDCFPDRTLVLTLDDGAERARVRDGGNSESKA